RHGSGTGKLVYLRSELQAVTPALPVISEPLPGDHVTLAGWGAEIGRSPHYIQTFWRPLTGFPSPVGRLPGPGPHGSGTGKLVYLRSELQAFRGLPRNRPMRETTLSRDARVRLGYFADNIADVRRKTVTQYRDDPTFPKMGEDGTYRLG